MQAHFALGVPEITHRRALAILPVHHRTVPRSATTGLYDVVRITPPTPDIVVIPGFQIRDRGPGRYSGKEFRVLPGHDKTVISSSRSPHQEDRLGVNPGGLPGMSHRADDIPDHQFRTRGLGPPGRTPEVGMDVGPPLLHAPLTNGLVVLLPVTTRPGVQGNHQRDGFLRLRIMEHGPLHAVVGSAAILDIP